MSYQSEVLADNPVLYYRLDQVGFGTNGESVPDLGSAGLDATLVFAGTQAVWGHPSPIETDLASKEFWGYQNASVGISGFDGNSRIELLSDPVLDPSGGDCAIEDWLRPMDEIPTAADFAMVQMQGSIGIMLTGAGGGPTRIGGFLFDSVATLWRVVDTSIIVTDHLGDSFHVAVERLGNALALYINGQLKGTTTITSGLPTLFSGSPFRIQGATLFYNNARHDEVAYYLTAPGGARWLVHYEAALAVLNSSVTITVRVPVSLDTDSVEPVDFAFAHNWADPIGGSERPVVEHLSWRTHNNRSQPDYQQRVNARPHGPQRSLEYSITPTSARARTALQRTLWQPAQFYKLPIATDWVELTSQADPSDAVIDCDTTLRDFEVGSYVTVWGDVYDPSSAQVFKITSRSDTQLGVSPVVSSTLPVGSQLMPSRLACLPDESSTFDSYTIDSETGVFRFEVLATELSSRRVTTYVPDSTHESIEVFNLDSARFDILEQVQYSINRRQAGTGLLTGNDYYRGIDTLAPVTVPVRVLLGTRETLSEFYGWLEARQGRQNPVWVPSQDNDLEIVQVISDTQVKTRGYSTYNLHYGRRHLQLAYSSGDVRNRKITAMVDNGDGTETLTYASTFGTSGSLTKISFLRLCVAPDNFELRFHRDIAVTGAMVVECAWEFTELLTTP